MAIRFQTIRLEKNRGHGNARREAIRNCTNNLVALMDSDDLSVQDRFEKQIPVLEQDPELAIVGGQIEEFTGTPENVTGRRIVPEEDTEIKEYMKRRCPMNQVTVAFRRDYTDFVGGYIDWYCNEDYYLWIRTALAGGKFRNVPDVLVRVRVGDAMSARRGGWKYFKSEAGIQNLMLKEGMISLPRYLYNIAIRFVGEVVVPSKIRTKLFRFLRKPPETGTEQPAASAILQNKAIPFSVAMCVYGGDRPDWFSDALDSVIHQTMPPEEIVLVVDGPVPDEIQNVITKYETICGGLQ